MSTKAPPIDAKKPFASVNRNNQLQRKCDLCPKKRYLLQRSSIDQSQPEKVPAIVEEVLRSPGQPLDQDSRSFFEPMFGHDFSKVRLYTDARAGESAEAVNALAYTLGSQVVFRSGQFSPGTQSGDRLLAHELTHVVQQAEVINPQIGKISIDNDEKAEKNADTIAEDVAARRQRSSDLSHLRHQSVAGNNEAGKDQDNPAYASHKLRISGATYPVTMLQRQVYGGSCRNVSDPNAIIPIADLIRYVEAVERGYPNDSPSDIVTRIRVQYYGDYAFKRLIPQANYVETRSEEVVGKGGALFQRNVDYPRIIRSSEIGEDAYKHLTAHADENCLGDNPSPYIQLVTGERIDLGHLLLGLDALLHPATSAPFTVYGVPNIDPASWVADLAIASVWMTQHVESGSPPSDAPRKLSAPNLNEYYSMSAPEEDLLGDVDTFGVHAQWTANPGQRLSQILRGYYMGQAGQSTGIGTRWRRFCAKNGFQYSTLGKQVLWYPEFKNSVIDRVDRFSDLFADGTWGSLWGTATSPISPPKRRKWPYTTDVVDKFLNWVKSKLEMELSSANP